MSEFTKSAPRAINLASVDANALIDIKQLSALRNTSIRSLRTLIDKGVLSRFVFGHRFQRFTLARFDADIAKYEIKSSDRNGRGAG
jgi:hypothetical protein